MKVDTMKKRRRTSRRITINAEDVDALSIIYGTFSEDDEAADPEWLSNEDRKKISSLYKKINGLF